MSKLSDLINIKTKLQKGGGEEAINNQHSKGKMTARERIDKIFDKGTFIETGLFVKHRCTNFGIEKKEIPYDGVITGYGQINGRLVYVVAQDYTVLGGSLGEMHAEKIAKCQESALKVGAPIIYICDSSGARLYEGVDALAGYGKIFYNNTLCSGVIPQISIIMGVCAGGAVYCPALSDFIFMVDGTSEMFVTGPQVIMAKTGAEASIENIGGAKTHSSTSGVSHFLSTNEDDCIVKLKELLSYLPQNNMEKSEKYKCDDDLNRNCQELNTIISEDLSSKYDMKKIIKIIADNNKFFEIQSDYAKNIIIGFIHLNGKTVGVVANEPNELDGFLDINASDKSARFIRTCDCFNIPILTLVDVLGFLPDKAQENDGIIRHSAKMIYAYSEASVPMVSLILRKAYGSAYLSMCPKQLGADVVYAWPTAEIAIMGAEAATNIVYANEIKTADNPSLERLNKINKYQNLVMNPYIAASRGYVDDIIEPAMTRKMLITAFDTMETKVVYKTNKKHGNMPL